MCAFCRSHHTRGVDVCRGATMLLVVAAITAGFGMTNDIWKDVNCVIVCGVLSRLINLGGKSSSNLKNTNTGTLSS